MELRAAEIRSASPVETGTVIMTRMKVFSVPVKVRIVEHIGVIVHAYAVKGLGCRIVTLFKEYTNTSIRG